MKTPLNLSIGIDMQELYDNLIAYRNSVDAQIASLAKDLSICTHTETDIRGNCTICIRCGRILDRGGV